MKLSRLFILAITGMLTFGAGGASAGGGILDTSFDALPPGWVIQNGEITAEPLGNKYVHLVSAPNSKDMPRLMTQQNLQLSGEGDLKVEFRYRTDVEGSSFHNGAWAYIAFSNAEGKSVKADNDGFIIQKSGVWNKFSDKIKIPAGAAKFLMQIRIQSKPDKFLDIDDLKISVADSTASVAKPADDPFHDPAMTEVVKYVLQLNGRNSELKGSDGETLKNLAGSDKVYGFLLPDKYCDHPEYRYGVKAGFKTNWSNGGGNQFSTIFSFGQNFSGQDPNSTEISFVGANSPKPSLYFRVMCDERRGRMDYAFRNTEITKGKDYEAVAIFSRNDLLAFGNGKWEKASNIEPFNWIKGRNFYLGGSSANGNLLNGEILSFSLTVFKPRFRAEIEGGQNSGLFYGNNPHPWGVLFPDGGGKKASLNFTITDFLGKTYPAPKITEVADGSIRFSLPQLPYGWYNMKIKAGLDGNVQNIERAFAVTPELDLTVPADESPLGITQAFSLKKERFSAEYVERVMRVSAAAGNRWFRVWTEWDDFEQSPGKRDWTVMDKVVAMAQKYNLELYINISGGNLPWQTSYQPGTPRPTTYLSQYMPRNLDQWSDFVTDFAGRYRGKVKYFQIGNENDTKEFFQPCTPESYLKLLKTGYLAVKKGNPDALVGLPGFCAVFGEGVMEKPAMESGDRVFGAKMFWDLKPEPYYDILDFHYYSMGVANLYWDNSIPAVRRLWDFLKRRGEGNKPMWNSETGFQSGTKGARAGYDDTPLISDYEQACRIVEWHMQSQSVNIARSFNYLVTGTSGFFQDDFAPKVSYAASVNISRMLQGMKFEKELPLVSSMFGYYFSGKITERYMACVWCRTGSFPLAIIATPDSEVTKVDLFGNQSKLPAVNGVSLVTIDEAPVYFVSKKPFDVVSFIAATPMLSSEPGKVKIRINVINPTLKPMQITMGAGFPGSAPVRREFTVPNGEKQEIILMVPQGKGNPAVDVKIAGDANTSFAMVVPYTVRPQLELPSGGSVELKINRQEQVKVGGEEMDSQNRVLTPSKWHGPADSSAVVQLTRNGNKINFKIQVSDDQVVTTPARAPYDQDSVELFYALLDSAGKASGRGQIVVRADGKVFPMSKSVLPDFQVSSEQNAHGYVLSGSFTLPEEALKQHAMLFDVAIDDADAADHGRRTQIIWAGTADNCGSAANYGAVILP